MHVSRSAAVVCERLRVGVLHVAAGKAVKARTCRWRVLKASCYCLCQVRLITVLKFREAGDGHDSCEDEGAGEGVGSSGRVVRWRQKVGRLR